MSTPGAPYGDDVGAVATVKPIVRDAVRDRDHQHAALRHAEVADAVRPAPSLLAHTRIGDRIADSPYRSRDFGGSERNLERIAATLADTTQTHAGIHARDRRSRR